MDLLLEQGHRREIAMAFIRELKDKLGKKIYPVTTTEAVYLPNGVRTLDNALGDVMDQTAQIKFDGSGNITKTLANGNKVVTRFLLDGSIEETITNADGKVIQTKAIAFSDGQIDITVN